MQPAGRNLAVAIASGVALAIVFIASLLWHPAAFATVVAVLCLVAYAEVERVLAVRERVVDLPVLVVSTIVMLAGAYRSGHAGQVVGVAVLFVGAVLSRLADRRRNGVTTALASTLFLGLWIGFLASFAVLIAISPSGGPAAVLAVIGGAAIADIGAYAVGSLVGRHAVAPSISPKKTWEGLAGGLALAGAAGAVVLPLLDDRFEPASAAALAIIAGVAGFLGDLTESMVKRDLGVKDLGAFVPGHGGILDRADSILLALPVGFYAVELLV